MVKTVSLQKRFQELVEDVYKGCMDQPKPPSHRDVFGTFATSLFIQVCTVVQGIVLARLLGPVGRGEFATVILWPNVFAGIGILGVNMALACLAGKGHSVKGLIKTGIGMALTTGGVAALCCGLLLPTLLPADKHGLLTISYLFLFFIPLNHVALNLQGIDQGRGEFRSLNFSRAILYPVFFFGVVVCWLHAEDKILWTTIALLAANCGVVVLLVVGHWGTIWSPGKGIGVPRLLKESRPFLFANAIAIVYMQADKALLVWLIQPEEIGWYMAAFSAAGSINTLNNSLGMIQFSAAAQAQSGCGFDTLASAARQAVLFSFLGGIAIAVLLPWILPLVYGEAFHPATAIAFLLLPGVMFAGIGDILNQAMRGQGRPIAGIISKVLGSVVMAIVSIPLAARFGGKGIACGFALGELVAFIGIIWVAMNWYDDAAWSKLLLRKDDLGKLWNRLLRKKTY